MLGGSLSYVALGARLGRTAAVVGVVAALLPDSDVFIRSATDPLLAIEHHRGFTHSLLFAPIGAWVAAGFVWLWPAARRSFLQLWAAACLAYVSHCLLDAATSYGTQLLWPLTNLRVGWDWISIIDPVFTLTLALGFGVGLARRNRSATAAGLAIALGYLGIGVIQHARALQAVQMLASSRGQVPERTEAMPTLGNNLIWRTLYLHDGLIQSDRVRVGWFSAPRAIEGWAIPLVTASELTEIERTRDARGNGFSRFAWFSDGWVGRAPDDPGMLADMRYSLSGSAFDPIWGIRFTEDGAPTDVEWINRTRERKIEPAALWREIIGRDARYRLIAPAGAKD